MIACRKCGQSKDISQFSLRSKAKNAYHTQCKACIAVLINKHYEKNKEEYKNRVTDWVKANQPRRRTNHRNSYALHKGYLPCDCCDKSEIDSFLADCPEGFHVDHILTVRKKGKHCLSNLQYLSISDHCRKSAYERT